MLSSRRCQAPDISDSEEQFSVFLRSLRSSMPEEWFSIAVARSIQRELNVRAVSVLRLDPDHSQVPHELVLKQVAKISEPSSAKWDQLYDEKYSYAETWGLTGTVFLNRKVIQASLYEWGDSGGEKVGSEVSHEKFGHEGYVKVFERWFDEPLAHVLIIPIYLDSMSLGAIKILNRLDANGHLVLKDAPFAEHEQAFAEGLASVLAGVWNEGSDLDPT